MNLFLKTMDRHFAALADKVALRDDITRPGITYRQFDELSGRVYRYLKEHAIGREDTVLLLLPRSIQMPVGMMGVWKAGASFVVCEDTAAPEQVAYLRQDSHARLVIDSALWPEIMACEPLPGRQTVHPHDLAYIVYTSGTTGNPKGTMHEFGSMEKSCDLYYEGKAFQRQDDIHALISPMSFIAMMVEFLRVFCAGATMFIVPNAFKKNPRALIELFEAAGVTDTYITPSLLRTIRAFNSQIRWLGAGGESCAGVYRPDVPIFNKYGSSETGGVMCTFLLDRAYDVPPVGKNQDGRKLLVLDEQMQEVPDGEIGEVCFESAYVRGYCNLPEETAKHWHDGLYFTGDYGRKLPDGNLIILGRKDDMLKLNGNRVEPAEIEAAAKRLLGLSWTAVKGFVAPERSYIALYHTDSVRLDPSRCRKLLAQALPDYMIPSYYIHLDTIPLNSNGKLDRAALPAPDPEQYRTEYVAPESETEQRLLAAFEDVLGVRALSVNDDFYELGGDSLRTIELITRFGDPTLTAQMVYEHRTVRALSRELTGRRSVSEEELLRLEHAARQTDQPFLSAQLHLLDNQLSCLRCNSLEITELWKMPRAQVDPERLERAFDTLIRHHPMLRSQVRFDEDLGFVLHYDPALPPVLDVIQTTEEVFRRGMDDLISLFPLIEAPLYRFRIFLTEDSVYVLMDFNHLFNDGYSLNVLLQNLSDAYHGRPLPHDYAYLYHQEAYRRWKGEPGERARRHNREKYGQRTWCRNITPDMESSSNHGSELLADFPAPEDELERYLKQNRMTVNALCAAAALMAIHIYEKKNDVLVSWAYQGRDDLLYNHTVAACFKELPLAVSFDGLDSPGALIAEVKSQIREGLMYLDDPYVMETTAVGVNDAFRVRSLETLQGKHGIEGIPTERIPLVSKDWARSLMSVVVTKDGEGKHLLRLGYADQRYCRESVERFMALYRNCILELLRS